MSERTIITWNVANWVTVALMALVGFIAVRLILDGVARLVDKSDD